MSLRFIRRSNINKVMSLNRRRLRAWEDQIVPLDAFKFLHDLRRAI